MANNNKSFFNEIGFKPTIDKLVDLTAKLYLEDDNPWVVGYSGGKDSFCLSSVDVESIRENKI